MGKKVAVVQCEPCTSEKFISVCQCLNFTEMQKLKQYDCKEDEVIDVIATLTMPEAYELLAELKKVLGA